MFASYKQALIQVQPAEVQARVASTFDEVMTGIQPSLDAQYRDKFTQVCLSPVIILLFIMTHRRMCMHGGGERCIVFERFSALCVD